MAEVSQNRIHIAKSVVLISASIVTLSFIFHCHVFPNLQNIEAWDQCSYMKGASLLASGVVPLYANNPGLCALYAPFFPLAISINASIWLPLIIGFGNQFLFVLFLVGLFALGHKVGSNIVYSLGIMAGWPVYIKLLYNASDFAFSVISLFVFILLLTIWAKRSLPAIASFSFLLGYSCFVRTDGLVLVFTMLSVLICREILKSGRQPKRKILTFVLTLTIPIILVFGSYMMWFYRTPKNEDNNLKKRSYLAFEQGHYFSIGKPEFNMIDAQLQTRKVFGSPEDNDQSVIKAYLHHPSAGITRIFRNLVQFPATFLRAIDFNGCSLVLFPFLVMGFMSIYHQRKWDVLLPVLTFPLYLLIYLLFFFREGYLLHISFVYFVLLGFGIRAYIEKSLPQWTHLLATTSSVLPLLIINYQVPFNYLMGFICILVASAAVYHIGNHKKNRIFYVFVIFLSFIGAWLPKVTFSLPPSEQSPEFIVSEILYQYVQPGNWVMGYSHKECTLSFTVLVPIDAESFEIDTESEWIRFLSKYSPTKAVYINPFLERANLRLYNFIQDQDKKSLELKFQDSSGKHKIFTVNSDYVLSN